MKYVILYLALGAFPSTCNPKTTIEKSPDGFNLNKYERFSLPESLLEVSGICFYHNNDDTIYAIQDEEGKLFRLATGERRQLHAKFARHGDYEDLAIINEKVIILKSNGNLYLFNMEDAKYEEVEDVKQCKNLLPDGEYEAIYGDPLTNNLYVLCKHCDADDGKETLSGYVLHVDEEITPVSNFTIDVNSIKHFAGKIKRGFRPSALAKNPVSNEWFIVSAVNQLLVVTDGDWKIKNAYPLPGKIFNQPEGITFNSAGDMFISNEGDEFTQGNILKFKYQQ